MGEGEAEYPARDPAVDAKENHPGELPGAAPTPEEQLAAEAGEGKRTSPATVAPEEFVNSDEAIAEAEAAGITSGGAAEVAEEGTAGDPEPPTDPDTGEPQPSSTEAGPPADFGSSPVESAVIPDPANAPGVEEGTAADAAAESTEGEATDVTDATVSGEGE